MSHHRQLNVEGCVNLITQDRCVQLRSCNQVLSLQLPGLIWTFRQCRRSVSFRGLLAGVSRGTAILRHTGLSVRIGTGRRTLITVGSDSESWLPRLVGLRHIKIHLFSAPPL